MHQVKRLVIVDYVYFKERGANIEENNSYASTPYSYVKNVPPKFRGFRKRWPGNKWGESKNNIEL
ncbi:hypothetical protein [Paenibacillus phytorum]|uniref:hypothetical protein n=1 Tax=Paenibacillus phytorum TaxID=2654977 RepID=UPI001492AA45|nr:hypothetical protein [Paenibacillus phytorum]